MQTNDDDSVTYLNLNKKIKRDLS
uniref:Uncharacterized protein n=1 Tax=Rhizophora mucronata TaxID=61149 RepID=A0A2P2NAC2_RHIMU